MTTKKGFIICVDDQPEIVDVLMMQLENAVGDECEIEVAESADEALQVLAELTARKEIIDLVITDEIMPGMQGSKFLEKVYQLDADIMTMLLTGQAGLNDVVYAVNHANLASCLKKPWEYDELKTVVKNLVNRTRMNRRNHQLAQEVAAEKDKAEAIVHSISDGILVIDSNDRISLVNAACLNILGRSERELLGTRILDAFEVKELIRLHIDAAEHTDRVVSDEILWPHPTNPNAQLYIVAVAKTLRDKNGSPLGVVTVLRDVTREKEISALKANFLATVSHELRTPLTSIISTFELLMQNSLGELTVDQREFIETSKEQGKILSDLIDNLIDLSSLEANQIELTFAPLDMGNLALEIAEFAKKSADAKGLQFALHLQPDLPPIIGDRVKLERMLKALISNAVKFTKDGGVKVAIRLKMHGNPPQEWVLISIRDTGIGIAQEDFGRIFDKFYQVDNSTTREFRGSGIGLSVCKAIVEAHHGHIWVESEVRQGATFHVLLPLTQRTT
jgi:two-component system, OmpR family, phosphate regulon sensor histidine kinase PhoR